VIGSSRWGGEGQAWQHCCGGSRVRQSLRRAIPAGSHHRRGVARRSGKEGFGSTRGTEGALHQPSDDGVGLGWDAGGNETEAIAALLHDAVEDGHALLDQVRDRFGADIARIVDHTAGADDLWGRFKGASGAASGTPRRWPTWLTRACRAGRPSRIPIDPTRSGCVLRALGVQYTARTGGVNRNPGNWFGREHGLDEVSARVIESLAG